MSALRIGILAEDETDCDTLTVLVRRLSRSTPLGVRTQSFGGCARLRQKAGPTMRLTAREGCEAIIVVHDLDRNPNNGELNDEKTLRTKLNAIDVPFTIERLICIPVEELEAWFWSDPEVLSLIGPHAKASPSPSVPPVVRRSGISETLCRRSVIEIATHRVGRKAFFLKRSLVGCETQPSPPRNALP